MSTHVCELPSCLLRKQLRYPRPNVLPTSPQGVYAFIPIAWNEGTFAMCPGHVPILDGGHLLRNMLVFA